VPVTHAEPDRGITWQHRRLPVDRLIRSGQPDVSWRIALRHNVTWPVLASGATDGLRLWL
jgi:hypothetical protein